MHPLRTYQYLELSRRRIFDWARPLTPAQYSQPFPIGLSTLARTLTHVMSSEWYYIERLAGRPVPPQTHWPIRDEDPPPLATLERAWADQAARTRREIAAVRDWDAPIEYQITDDDNRLVIITASATDIFTQLALHEVHHRAQAMFILRHLGVPAPADIDFNTLMYRRRPARAGEA